MERHSARLLLVQRQAAIGPAPLRQAAIGRAPLHQATIGCATLRQAAIGSALLRHAAIGQASAYAGTSPPGCFVPSVRAVHGAPTKKKQSSSERQYQSFTDER